eukprot:46218-Eustigmatos_ZCMA.PRE.1
MPTPPCPVSFIQCREVRCDQFTTCKCFGRWLRPPCVPPAHTERGVDPLTSRRISYPGRPGTLYLCLSCIHSYNLHCAVSQLKSVHGV